MLRLALFALVLSSAPAAGQGDCRTDALGETICRDLPPRVVAPRPRPTIPVEPGAELRPDRFIPSTRRDAFGRVRPDRDGLIESPRFGTSPRPGPVQLPCRTDAFGNTICP
jgi:hypothetical protein